MKRKKKGIALILFLLIAAMLSGCVRYEIRADVKEDGKADFSVLLAAADDVIESREDIYSESKISSLKLQGIEVEEYDEDNYTGYIFRVKDAAISEDGHIPFLETFLEERDEPLLKKEGGYYILNCDFYKVAGLDDMNLTDYETLVREAGGYMRVIVSLPQEAEEFNAQKASVDGKTFTWNLLLMKEGDKIYLKVKEPEPSYRTGIKAAFVLLFLCILMYLVMRGKKKNDDGFHSLGFNPNYSREEISETDNVWDDQTDEIDELVTLSAAFDDDMADFF